MPQHQGYFFFSFSPKIVILFYFISDLFQLTIFFLNIFILVNDNNPTFIGHKEYFMQLF